MMYYRGIMVTKQQTITNELAGIILLKYESRKEFDTVAGAVLAKYQPQTCTEDHLVEMMIAARWSAGRMLTMQSAALDLSRRDLIDSAILERLERFKRSYNRQFKKSEFMLHQCRSYLSQAA